MTQGEVIYVNGCSFTTGIDIADYILIKGTPPGLSFNDFTNFSIEAISEHMNNYNIWRYSHYDNVIPGLYQLNYAGLTMRYMLKIRYTAILEKLTGIPVINKSAPGCDNNSIYLRTCNDVYNLKKQGYNVKKIIFQFTDPSRFSYIKETTDFTDKVHGDHYLDFNKLDDDFICRSINHANRNQPSYTDYEKYFIEKNPTPLLEASMKLESKWLNYFSKLNMYKDAIKGATGIEPIMVDSIFMEAELDKDMQKYSEDKFNFLNKPDMDTYIGRIITSLFPKGIDSMARMMDKDEESLTGGFHFNKKVHELFATHLARKYFNE
jgi:hypothetical protein